MLSIFPCLFFSPIPASFSGSLEPQRMTWLYSEILAFLLFLCEKKKCSFIHKMMVKIVRSWGFVSFFFFLKIVFIYSWDTHTHRQREAETQVREKQAPRREPDAGLDSGSPGSCPGLKVGTKLLDHPILDNSNHLHPNFHQTPKTQYPSFLFCNSPHYPQSNCTKKQNKLFLSHA